MRKEDAIDHGAGLTILAGVGEMVEKDQPLVHIHARSEAVARRVLPRLAHAWAVTDEEVERPPHVRYRVDREGPHRLSRPRVRA
jgi:thymidine phosphorylase